LVRDKEICESDRRLLTLVERQFPLVEQPFEYLGRQLGCGGAEVMGRLAYLRDQAAIIRRICGIFEGRLLGYDVTLVAAEVGAGKTDQVAAVINSHPGVSHNYLRQVTQIDSLSEDRHFNDVPACRPYNLWFTLAVSSDSRLGIDGTLQQFGQVDGVDAIRIHRVQKLYKLKVRFFSDQKEPADSVVDLPRVDRQFVDRLRRADDPMRRAVVALQGDLPLTDRPFDQLAKSVGLTGGQLLECAEQLLNDRVMRTYRATINHHRAGVVVNVMLAFDVSNCSQQQIVKVAADDKHISHCYLRDTYDDWPFGLFAMLHWQGNLPGCIRYIKDLSTRLDSAGLACWSVKEHCKRSVNYLSDAFAKWDASYCG